MNATLPLFSTMALGLIAGVTGTHFHQVSSMVQDGVTPAPVVYHVPESEAPVQQRTGAQLAVNTPSAKHAMVKTPTRGLGRTPRERDLLDLIAGQTEMLAAMRSEQKHLRKQLSETNRDMDELTFRVDSHSTDFRPLRVDSTRPRGLITVPDNVPAADATDGGVLPAKQ